MSIGTYTKQPVDVTDIDVDFTDWLSVRTGDSVSTATAVSDLPSLTVSGTAVASPLVKVWVAAGADGVTYKVTLTVVTVRGRTKQVEFKVKVKET